MSEQFQSRPQTISTIHDGDIRLHVAGRRAGVEVRVALYSTRHGSAASFNFPIVDAELARDFARALLEAAEAVDGVSINAACAATGVEECP